MHVREVGNGWALPEGTGQGPGTGAARQGGATCAAHPPGWGRPRPAAAACRRGRARTCCRGRVHTQGAARVVAGPGARGGRAAGTGWADAARRACCAPPLTPCWDRRRYRWGCLGSCPWPEGGGGQRRALLSARGCWHRDARLPPSGLCGRHAAGSVGRQEARTAQRGTHVVAGIAALNHTAHHQHAALRQGAGRRVLRAPEGVVCGQASVRGHGSRKLCPNARRS